MLNGLERLVGVWEGNGRGVYPTIEPFTYGERVEFTHSGKPFLLYRQTTWTDGADRQPLHTETGYFRPGPDGGVEAVIAQPTGISEILTGSWDGTTVRLSTRSVGLTPSAKEVRTVERILEVGDEELAYQLWMEAVGQPHQIHLAARLQRLTS
ncbi:MAG: FABP family protein [Acidimicrobiia bacterium]|nr:FABP family protein [Acidimicrobiia bacterium]